MRNAFRPLLFLTTALAASLALQVHADGDKEDSVVAAALQASFEAKRQAGMERLDQDETQKLCTQSRGGPLATAVAGAITAMNQATIKGPADGNYFGDIDRGETVARVGSGFQSNDDPAKPAGGNCYACHELTAQEVAFGTIGPSLRQYAKLRGTSPMVVEYTWSKLYNSNATMPCSNMPRFGHKGILTEQQLKDVMAFLLDPSSPVNE